MTAADPSPDLRAARRSLRSLTVYSGPESIHRAVALRQALLAVPGRGGRERRRLLREVERRVGFLLREGRERGEVASNGDRRGLSARDLGLRRDVATDCSALALPTDDAWLRLLEQTDAREPLAAACRVWHRSQRQRKAAADPRGRRRWPQHQARFDLADRENSEDRR